MYVPALTSASAIVGDQSESLHSTTAFPTNYRFLFGIYIDAPFLLSQTAFIDLDVNLLLEGFDIAFAVTTVLWEVINTRFGWIRT